MIEKKLGGFVKPETTGAIQEDVWVDIVGRDVSPKTYRKLEGVTVSEEHNIRKNCPQNKCPASVGVIACGNGELTHLGASIECVGAKKCLLLRKGLGSTAVEIRRVVKKFS